MKRRAGNALGMTLVELMIVVVIIGILAAISVVGYRKYIGRARLSEATAMLAEFAAKEQLYFLDNGQYMEAHKTSVNYPSVNEDAAEFYPSDPSAYFDSARTPAALGALPASWRRLGIRPRWNALYCTYMVNAGCPLPTPPATAPNCTPASGGSVGLSLWAAPPNVPWFYAMAACNIVGQAGWPNAAGANHVTLMTLTHDSPQIRTDEENQ